MASIRATDFTINSNKITLTAGSWKLIWGSLDPKQFDTSKIVIGADVSDGNVNIILPPTNTPQSLNSNIIITTIPPDKEDKAIIYPIVGNTINGRYPITIELISGKGATFYNLVGHNWIGIAYR